MAYFLWADDMAIDHGVIDADHQRLIEQLNTLHGATSQGEGQSVVAGLLEALVASTREHLQREEQIMQALGFPDLERHLRGHAAFVARLLELQAQYAAGRITTASRLSTLLRDWLSLHIRRADKSLQRLIAERAAQASARR
ncbi:hemerythrin-like metal-binding protein [Sphaerotilus hippei]|uniref:Hemerythrin-like metal-binding protein n=1 Tax=Sphaerotilus hippei TaxID=744406 RepID=A0A318H5B6_9BURK|nr:bacteriohemerythrin [Sphaerotilus hippei]PXW97451.1 hemerythrin-like metal-binding protein [Sphaerotilus hippei]